MSKDRRVDPQIQIGLLVDPGGLPLDLHGFEGNEAETLAIVPVLKALMDRHGVEDLVVVADAGRLSATDLKAIEDAGFHFIAGPRIVTAPHDLADHFERHCNYFRRWTYPGVDPHLGQRECCRDWRVIYQWSFKRQKCDYRNINLMITRA